jgi:hypothetical protein
VQHVGSATPADISSTSVPYHYFEVCVQPLELRVGQKPMPARAYSVSIWTGNCKGAGTDANVSVTLIDADDRRVGPTVLKASTADFERGMLATFTVAAASPKDNILAIQAIILSHDGSGLHPDWFVDKVEVRSEGLRDAAFVIKDWIKAPNLSSEVHRSCAPAARPLKAYQVTVQTGVAFFPSTSVTG